MNISLQNVDKVSALLTLKLEKADYQEKVEAAVADGVEEYIKNNEQ